MSKFETLRCNFNCGGILKPEGRIMIICSDKLIDSKLMTVNTEVIGQ